MLPAIFIFALADARLPRVLRNKFIYRFTPYCVKVFPPAGVR